MNIINGSIWSTDSIHGVIRIRLGALVPVSIINSLTFLVKLNFEHRCYEVGSECKWTPATATVSFTSSSPSLATLHQFRSAAIDNVVTFKTLTHLI